MEELGVDFSNYSRNLIYFEANFFQDNYIFLINRNFKIEPIKTPFSQCYISLESCLDLKYFKMEIS